MTSSSTLLKLSEEKLNKYNEEIKNTQEMSTKIKSFLLKEYEEIFPGILTMSKKQFLQNIKKSVFLTLEDLYTNIIKEDTQLQDIFNKNFIKIEDKYEDNYNLLKKEWENFSKNTKKQDYLTKYRKHCFEDSEYATHNCSNKDAKFILISKDDNKENIEFVICSNCKKAYKSSFILCKCFHCDEEYYSQILAKNQDTDLFPATWKKYHCPQLINNKMSCIKCKCPFYLNMKTGLLNCINKNCQFVSKQRRILWTCNNCKKDFYSEAKVYNPLEREIIQKIINQTLLLKHRAHPNKMACCQLNVFFTEFYHKKNCRGILYLGEINDELIVVCEKCQAINYYDRFIWTCPKCHTKFRTKDKEATNTSITRNEEFINEFKKEIEKDKDKDIKKEIENKKEMEKERKKEIERPYKKDFENKKENIDKNEKNNINNNKDSKNMSNTDIKSINDEEKEVDLVKIIRKSSLKAVIDSPIKKKYNRNSNNSQRNRINYQSIRYRRHNRMKTEKEKEFNFLTVDESKINKPENNINDKLVKFENNIENKIPKPENHKENKIPKPDNNMGILYRKQERQKETKFNQIENKNKNENKKNNNNKIKHERNIKKYGSFKITEFKIDEDNSNKINEEQNVNEYKTEANIQDAEKKPKYFEKLMKLKNDDHKLVNRRRSLFMQYKELRLQNLERINKEQKKAENKEDNIKEENEKENEHKINKKKEDKKEDKTSNKGVFNRFLFLGSNNNNLKVSDNNDNFLRRNLYRRSSLQEPNVNAKIIEKISGKKTLLSSSSSSSSLSSAFSDKMNELKNNVKLQAKSNKSNKSIKSGNENCKEKSEKNSKKSTKVDSKEEHNNVNNKEGNENQEEHETEEYDETKGIEVDNKMFGSDSNPASSKALQLQKIQGISDHLQSNLSKKINHILSNSKINQFNMEEYSYSKKLGEGSYGIIHCLIHEKTQKKYALKKIIAYSLKKIAEFIKEFELVHLCQHPNILKIYGLNINVLDETTYSLQVLMEKAERDWDRDIKRRLQERKYYTEEELISIMRQLTSALLFMKDKLNITHRDIKPQNVLIFEKGIYKLADFGEAKEIKVSKNINTLRGTELYMSPALYNGLKINKDDVVHDPFKSDLFSLGFCLVYAATMNFNLLYELRNINNDEKIRKRIKEELKDNYSEKFIEIITKMVELEEKNRYDFMELSKEIEKNYGK